MRSRLLTLMSALALTLGGSALTASPAAADPAHCYGWNTHPDLHSSGGFSFGNGTAIRRGPYTDCDALGRGYPSHGIDVHCYVRNSNGVYWVYLRNLSTGVNGWSQYDALNPVGTGIANCNS